MVDTVRSPDLRIREYVTQLELNPQNVYYQTVRPDYCTPARCQFRVDKPSPNALLLNYATIEWRPTIRRLINDVAAAWDSYQFGASFKEGLPFANATRLIRCRINNENMDLQRPSRFFSCLNSMFGGSTNKSAASVSGGKFWDRTGSANFEEDVRELDGTTNDFSVDDRGLLDNERSFARRLYEAGFLNDNDVTLKCTEPVIAPPFNPFATSTKSLPNYCWFRKMSKVLKGVERIDLSYDFERNISACAIFMRSMLVPVAGNDCRLEIVDLDATLKLHWYVPPPSLEYPIDISYQVWNVREYETRVPSTNINGELDDREIVLDVRSGRIELNEMPTLIIVHAEVDKDYENYQCKPMYTISAADGTATPTPDISDDVFLRINAMSVKVGTQAEVINRSFTTEDLYHMALKNSDVENFPLGYEEWAGGHYCLNQITNAVQSYSQSGQCFAAFRPIDLGAKYADGVRFPTTLEVSTDLQVFSGLAGFDAATGGIINVACKLFVHLFYGKRMLTITPSQTFYREQTIVETEAGTAIEQPF